MKIICSRILVSLAVRSLVFHSDRSHYLYLQEYFELDLLFSVMDYLTLVAFCYVTYNVIASSGDQCLR